MKELLHQFGLFENRVQVGVPLLTVKESHVSGVVRGTYAHSGERYQVPIMVDRPGKLDSLNNAMVVDIVVQLTKLGVGAEVIDLHGTKKTFTYRVVSDTEVEFVSQSPRFTH